MGRLDYIDSVRGIAATAVVYLHLAVFLRHAGADSWDFMFFTEIVDAGKVGVVAFFIVSGMVIPHSLSSKASNPVKRFAVRRFFRLYPAYWLSALLAACFLWIADGKDLPGPFFLYTADGKDLPSTFVINLSMLQQFVGVPNLIGLYWTLQIELIFYVLCALIFVSRWTRNHHWIAFGFLAYAVIAAVVRGNLTARIPGGSTALALALMFWGSVWRRYVVDRDAGALRWSLRFLAAFAALMPVIAVLGYNPDLGFKETWYQSLLSYFTGVGLVIGLTTWRVQGRALSWLGRISYSTYLFHPIVIANYFMLVPVSAVAPHLHVAFVLALTLCAAHLIYVFVEAPSIKYGRTLSASGQNDATRVEN